jgi:hypothetical protein
MIRIHKSISNKIEYYKFRDDLIIETRLKIHKGHLTILGVYVPTEGREELSAEFYDKLQKLLDQGNNISYIMLIRNMNARRGNTEVTNIEGTIGEATLKQQR